MSTSGAYGFRINNTDKVTYNNSDSYPGGLGQDIIQFIKHNAIGVMDIIANNIKLVNKLDYANEQEVEKYQQYANTNVGNGDINQWYVLLRKNQSNLQCYLEGVEHMIDSSSFLLDSLYCEYAYIINLDTKLLEFYKGFNTKKLTNKGRYASICNNSHGYYGLTLEAQFDLQDIQKSQIDALSVMCSLDND